MATRYFIILSVLLAGLDQLTKYLAKQLVSPEDLVRLAAGEIGAVRNVVIPDFFYLTLNFNKGIAWGMLPQWSEYFTAFAIVMVLIILLILRKLERDEVWFKIALSFQMAGAIGNMIDRIGFKKVTDFIDVTLFPHANVDYSWTVLSKTFNFHLPYDWPIFNLADSFVVVGTVVLVIVLIFAREDPVPAEASEGGAAGQAHLKTFPEPDPWESDEIEMTHPGNVDKEEALVEITIDEEGEKLIPIEEADRHHPEEIEGDFGSTARHRKDTSGKGKESSTGNDSENLKDLSRRPERNK